MDTTHLHSIPYLFPVAPGRRETLESYTRRIQKKNRETAQHRTDLVRSITTARPDLSETDAWCLALEHRTGRPLVLDSQTHTMKHADGFDCADCASRIGERSLCRLCAQGAGVNKAPHLDEFVCRRHNIYVGPGTTLTDQSAATNVEIHAAVAARKLLRKGRLDSSLYTVLLDLFAEATPKPATPTSVQRSVFPALIQVAATITSVEFRQRFFDPTASFKESFDYLGKAVAALPFGYPTELRNALWLRYRPVFLRIRENLMGVTDYPRNSQHELPGPLELAVDVRGADELESFGNYLSFSEGLRIDDVNWPSILTPSSRGTHSWRDRVDTICLEGHRTVRTVQSIEKKARARKDACGVCINRILVPGFNDLPSTHPVIAAEFHPTRNRKPASEYFASSVEKVWWLCKKGHEWPATCGNRTSAGSGCPLCCFHVIVRGQNDLTTAYPTVAARWDPINPQDLFTISPRSCVSVQWRCEFGHRFHLTVRDAVDRGTCPTCDRETVTNDNALDIQRPDLVVQLHPTRNSGFDTTKLTVKSVRDLWWVCGHGHAFVAPVLERVAGVACTVCYPRRLHTGVNDTLTRYPEIATEWHPFLNSKSPSKVIPGNDIYWWRCLAVGHNLQQSVPHRVESGGCPDCPKTDRIAAC